MENQPAQPKPQFFMIGFDHMIFGINLMVLWDKHTLDYPIANFHTGFIKEIHNFIGKDGILTGQYHTHGVILQCQLWFLRFGIRFTPIVIKQKQPL